MRCSMYLSAIANSQICAAGNVFREAPEHAAHTVGEYENPGCEHNAQHDRDCRKKKEDFLVRYVFQGQAKKHDGRFKIDG